MRYALGENSVLVGQFDTGNTVTIKLLVLDNDLLLTLNSNSCLESTKIPGIFMWNTSNISTTNNLSGYTNVLYEMVSNTGKKYYGKIVYAGYVENNQPIDIQPLIDADATITDLVYLINSRI